MDARVAARCAVLSRALDEPPAGTAPVAPRWVCLEHRGAWPRDVGAHPDPVVAAFAGRAAEAGWRLLLIRRSGRRPAPDAARVYLADTAPQSARTTVLAVGGPAELAGLPLPGPGEPLPGATVGEPLLLVCTHGRRDRCCALDGRALVQALAAAGEPDVWECSHLGGHRFAPTALVLPHGYLYGRLDVAGAIAVHKAAGLGEMEPALCRGRSTWSAGGQVAELAVRAATGLRDADALTVADGGTGPDRGPAAGGGTFSVAARDGRRWQVEVLADAGSPRPESCGAGLSPSRPLRAVRVSRARSIG